MALREILPDLTMLTQYSPTDCPKETGKQLKYFLATRSFIGFCMLLYRHRATLSQNRLQKRHLALLRGWSETMRQL